MFDRLFSWGYTPGLSTRESCMYKALVTHGTACHNRVDAWDLRVDKHIEDQVKLIRKGGINYRFPWFWLDNDHGSIVFVLGLVQTYQTTPEGRPIGKTLQYCVHFGAYMHNVGKKQLRNFARKNVPMDYFY